MTSLFPDIATLRSQLDSRAVSATELAQEHLKRVKAASSLNAFVDVNEAETLAQAKAADARLAAGETAPLLGIPLAHKDIFVTTGFKSTAGSRMLANYQSPFNAEVVQRLALAGAVSLGKLNCDEFAMGSSNENSAFGPCHNPWHAHAVPGGSSGGSAAAVAAGLVPVATGTDTGGSIRQPSAFCGVTGIKPTYGSCSRYGMIAYASSLDQAGPMARSVEDCAIMLGAMAGFDPKDATSLKMDVPDWEAALNADLRGKKVGIPREYRMEGTDQAILDSWEQGKAWLKDAGAEIVDVSLPHTKYALPAYYIVAPAEASSNLARYDGVRYGLRDLPDGSGLQDMYAATRAAGFGDEVKRRILIGTYVLSAGFYDAYYTQAQKVRALVARDFERAFQECDVILAPTTPTASFPLGSMNEDPLTMYLNDVFAVPASLAGLPAMSVPATINADGLPLGLQLVGKPFDEQGVLNAGLAIQQRAGFTAQPVKWW
ncbi:MAG: Asp-tRNA(Asn)/Glu-tRNA(Gln) amidotransferase subunit GatA [Limnobacter sp.]|nr:Asp-tRNA(Asn)/Glu-tRNA(Gln) amidotransferase subunit GatA [Limnobacter sp.]